MYGPLVLHKLGGEYQKRKEFKKALDKYNEALIKIE